MRIVYHSHVQTVIEFLIAYSYVNVNLITHINLFYISYLHKFTIIISMLQIFSWKSVHLAVMSALSRLFAVFFYFRILMKLFDIISIWIWTTSRENVKKRIVDVYHDVDPWQIYYICDMFCAIGESYRCVKYKPACRRICITPVVLVPSNERT